MSLVRKTLVNIGDRIQLGNFDTAFVITVKTDNTGTSADNQIMLPIQGTNMVIDWGDGTQSVHTQTESPDNTLVDGNNVVHTYSEAGTYNVRISKEIERINFNNGGDKDKVLFIRNWGVAEWETFFAGFRGCTNLEGVVLDAPINSVNFYNSIFRDTKYNSPVNDWDMSLAEQITEMFRNSPFNQPMNNWDVRNVEIAVRFLRDASAFNQSLEDWEIESINSTAGQSMASMLDNCGMSTENYSRTLIGWANYVKSSKGGENLPANVILGADGMEYDDTTYADVQTHGASDPFTDAVAARAYLTSDAGSDPAWTITGDANVS